MNAKLRAGHYVIVHEWVTENNVENIVNIIGVAHTLEEAKTKFKKVHKEEKKYAEENNYKIYENSNESFDAGEDGNYTYEHTRLYIKPVD